MSGGRSSTHRSLYKTWITRWSSLMRLVQIIACLTLHTHTQLELAFHFGRSRRYRLFDLLNGRSKETAQYCESAPFSFINIGIPLSTARREIPQRFCLQLRPNTFTDHLFNMRLPSIIKSRVCVVCNVRFSPFQNDEWLHKTFSSLQIFSFKSSFCNSIQTPLFNSCFFYCIIMYLPGGSPPKHDP